MTAIAVSSTASRNGLLTDHQIVEINGTCVVGLRDKEIRARIESEPDNIAITVIPTPMFSQLVEGMSEWLVKNKMNHN